MILTSPATTCNTPVDIYSPEIVVQNTSLSIAYFIVRGRLSSVRGGNAGCAVFHRSELATKLGLSERRVMQLLRDPRWFQEVKILERGSDPLLRIKIVALAKVVSFLGMDHKTITFVDGLSELTAKNFKPIVYQAVVGALQSLVDLRVTRNASKKVKVKSDKTGREPVDRKKIRSTKTIASLAPRCGTVGRYTLVKDLSDQAQVSQACLAKRVGRCRQTVSKWLKSTAKTRLCQRACFKIDRYMKVMNLTCAAIANPYTGRTELYRVYEGMVYRIGCYVYLVDKPALNKRSLKRAIRSSVRARDKQAVNGAFAKGQALTDGDKISQDGGHLI